MEKTRLEMVLRIKPRHEVLQMARNGDVRQYDVHDEFRINKILAKRLGVSVQAVIAYRAVTETNENQKVEEVF